MPLPFPEPYTALEQKGVDGQEKPITVVRDTECSEMRRHLSLTWHICNARSTPIGKRSWDRLSADEKRIVQDAAREATAYQRRVLREKNVQGLEGLKRAGMQVNEVPPDEIARMRERIKPVVDKVAAQAGEAPVGRIDAEIAKVRGAN